MLSLQRLLLSVFLLPACKAPEGSYSAVMVVNGTVITSKEDAQRYARGAYGVQMVYENSAGDIKQAEATGFFTDSKGTTFVTNGHVTDMGPPPGYTLKSRSIVDYQGNVVQNVPPNVEQFVNPGYTQSSRDLAMWRFPEGTTNLPHGSAQLGQPGVDLTTQNLRLAGYGVNTNSPSTETSQYQQMRHGPVGELDNPTGNTFGYYGPRLDSDTGRTVSSAPGDSGAPIYGTDGSVLAINRGGRNLDRDSSYSEAISLSSPGAQYFFDQAAAKGGVFQGRNASSESPAPSPMPSPSTSIGNNYTQPESTSPRSESGEAQSSQFSGNSAYSDIAQ